MDITITTKSSSDRHQEFIAHVEPIHGWSVQSLDCGAYVWHHPDHEKVKLFLTPFFEGYSRVLLTICTWGESPYTGDPTNTSKESMTMEQFRAIATRMIERAMNLGKLPDTRTV